MTQEMLFSERRLEDLTPHLTTLKLVKQFEGIMGNVEIGFLSCQMSQMRGKRSDISGYVDALVEEGVLSLENNKVTTVRDRQLSRGNILTNTIVSICRRLRPF